MGKATRLKVELEEVGSLLEILTVLKDVSSNRFFVYSGKKVNYQKFIDIFFKFFDLFHGVEISSPLAQNSQSGVDILVLTSELGFMSQLNSRVSALALDEYSKSPNSRLICIGLRGAEKCRSLGMAIEKIFSPALDANRFDFAIELRNYLIERVNSGVTGQVKIAYVFAKTLGVLKPHVIELLPFSAAQKQHQEEFGLVLRNVKHNIIFETNIDSIISTLAQIWVQTRIYEMLNDLQIVEAAAQAQQLESAIEGLSQEKKKVIIDFRKASREQLNAAMRGVITSTNMTKAKTRAKAKQGQ